MDDQRYGVVIIDAPSQESAHFPGLDAGFLQYAGPAEWLRGGALHSPGGRAKRQQAKQ
jgi:hypothetical protein